MATLTTQTDVAQLAKDRELTQDREQTNYENLLEGFSGGAQEIENVIADMRAALDIDQATGDQLDLLGLRVGELRNGKSDDTYRIFIKARTLVNKSAGRGEDVYAVARAFYTLSGPLKLEDVYPASWLLDTRSQPSDPALVNEIANLIISARSAGVGTGVLFAITGGAGLFQFSDEADAPFYPSDWSFDPETLGSIPAGGTFTRNSEAYTYQTDAGTPKLVKVSANVPRYCDHPSLGSGLWLEESATNIVHYATAMTNSFWETYEASMVSGATGPDDLTTAFTLDGTATTDIHRVRTTSVTTTANTRYFISAFVKEGTTDWVQLRLRVGTTDRGRQTYNVNTGTLGSSPSGIGYVDSGIVGPFKNNYYLCWMEVTTGGSTANMRFWIYGADADDSNSYLSTGDDLHIWGPQMTESDQLQSFIPTTTNADVTRPAEIFTSAITPLTAGRLIVNATAANNEEHNLDRPLVSMYSDANNKVEAQLGATDPAGSGIFSMASAIGATTAWDSDQYKSRYFDDNRHVYEMSFDDNSADTYVDDVWIEGDHGTFTIPSYTTVGIGCNQAGTLNFHGIIHSIELFGTPASDPAAAWVFDPCSTEAIPAGYTFSRSSVATTYQLDGSGNREVTDVSSNIPRYCDSLYGRGLLIEPSRTNLIQRSETFSNAYWTKTGSDVATGGQAAPDGSTDAFYMDNDTVSGNHMWRAVIPQADLTASEIYTVSAFVKPSTQSWVQLHTERTNTTDCATANYDLVNGVVGVTNHSQFLDAGIELGYKNGFARVWLRFQMFGTTSDMRLDIFAAEADNDIVFVGSSTDLVVFGAQWEVDGLSSYIRSDAGSNTTRAAEQLTYSLGTTVTSGTLLTSATHIGTPGYIADTGVVAELYVDANNHMSNRHTSTPNARTEGTIGGTGEWGINSGDPSDGLTHCIGNSFAQNDIQMYLDNTSVGTDTSTSAIPSFGNIAIGSTQSGASPFHGIIHKVAVTTAEDESRQ